MSLGGRWFLIGFGALVCWVGGRIGGRIMGYGLAPPPRVDLDLPGEHRWERSVRDNDRTLSPAAGLPHAFRGTDPFECAVCLCTPEHPIHRAGDELA